MTEDQQTLYDKVREMFHDENLNGINLSKSIAVMFPRAEDGVEEDTITTVLNDFVAPCLDARAELGIKIMDIFYQLENGEELE